MMMYSALINFFYVWKENVGNTIVILFMNVWESQQVNIANEQCWLYWKIYFDGEILWTRILIDVFNILTSSIMQLSLLLFRFISDICSCLLQPGIFQHVQRPQSAQTLEIEAMCDMSLYGGSLRTGTPNEDWMSYFERESTAESIPVGYFFCCFFVS